jgi:hypothetical protein
MLLYPCTFDMTGVFCCFTEHKESPTPTPTPTVTTVTTTTPGLAKVIYKTVPVPAQPWGKLNLR